MVPCRHIMASIRDALLLECVTPSCKLLLGGKLRLLGTYEALSSPLI